MRTVVALDDALPLTCTRSGTCCHGKDIRITAWELALLARARGQAAAAFRDACTVDGGTRLRLDGPPGWSGLPACSQYDPASGCTVHAARPLACRLYPLGRERQGSVVRIIHEGRRFPCLDGCPTVTELPRMTVRAYLDGQGAGPFAEVRDAYLEMSQDLAEGALGLVIDGGLAASADQRWRQAWSEAVDGGQAVWPLMLGGPWHDLLTIPELTADLDVGPGWVAAHAAAIQDLANAEAERSPAAACVRLFTGAMLLFHAVGGDAVPMGRSWLAQTCE